MLKADRAKTLAAALAATTAAVAPADAKPVAALATAQVRDGVTNTELGTISLESLDGGWRGKLLKLNDPRKPFKAFDRLIVSLPNKK